MDHEGQVKQKGIRVGNGSKPSSAIQQSVHLRKRRTISSAIYPAIHPPKAHKPPVPINHPTATDTSRATASSHPHHIPNHLLFDKHKPVAPLAPSPTPYPSCQPVTPSLFLSPCCFIATTQTSILTLIPHPLISCPTPPATTTHPHRLPQIPHLEYHPYLHILAFSHPTSNITIPIPNQHPATKQRMWRFSGLRRAQSKHCRIKRWYKPMSRTM